MNKKIEPLEEVNLIQEKLDKIGSKMDDLDSQINEAVSDEIEQELSLKFVELLEMYLEESKKMNKFLYLDRLQ